MCRITGYWNFNKDYTQETDHHITQMCNSMVHGGPDDSGIFIDKKTNEVKILFDKNSLEFKGWKTKDSYSNKVSFEINNLIINNQILDNFFKIPQEKDL